MRTRFLNTDYFFGSSPNETLRNFQFLSLPVPHLSPSDPLSKGEISCFDLDFSFSSEIDSFPYEKALSEFLSDVLPRFYHAGEGSYLDISSQKQCALSDEREQKDFRSETNEIEVSEKRGFHGENNGGTSGCFRSEETDKAVEFLYEDKEVVMCSIYRPDTCETRIPEELFVFAALCLANELQKDFHFEIAEVELPLREDVSSPGEVEAGFRFEVPNIEIPLATVNIEVELTITYPYKVAKSICSVEDITAEYNVDKGCCSVKDGNFSPDGAQLNCNKLPHFEVSEIGLEHGASLSMEETFCFLLPNIEHWHGARSDEWVLNSKEFLGSADIDILEHFSEHVPFEHCLERKPMSVNSVLEMDLININDKMLLEKNSAIYSVTSDGNCSHLPCSVYFQEVQILDFSSFQFSHIFSSSQTIKELEMSEQVLEEDMDPVGNFYELVVDSELALVDDTFKSLPAPVICDDKALISLSKITEDVLFALKPHPISACDGIYLDWHPLLEGTCNREICSTYLGMLEEVSTYNISDFQPNDEEIAAIDFDFCDDYPERPNMLQCKEVPTELCGAIPQDSDPSAKPALTQMFGDEINSTDTEEQIQKMNPEKVSFLFESMSQSNGLNFFLNARRGTARRSCVDKTVSKAGTEVLHPIVSLEDKTALSALPKVNFSQWDIEVHQVGLSDHILSLIDNIQKFYLAILENDTELRNKNSSFPVADDFEFLCLSKEKLMELITQKSASQFTLGCKDESVMAFIALYALKQLAYFLCFFGIHTAHLYISNLTKGIDNLTVRLRSLLPLVEDARLKVEKELIESHPSLSIIEGILRSNSSQSGKKTLIVAERVFWLPLNRRLTSLRIVAHEVRHAHTLSNQVDTLDSSEFTNSLLEALLHSDCLLISYEHVSASFPFNKFSIILEYGGPYASSRISSISPNLVGLPQVHFLKVKLEDHSLPKAFCEGFDVPQHLKLTMEGCSHSMSSLQGNLYCQHFEKLLNYVPVEEKNSCILSSESANQLKPSHDTESSLSMPCSVRSKRTNLCMSPFPDIVIVVNTRNSEKNMLISRRNSYQKILAMEKEGVQVVEREINLPLDLIFSAAVCLVWYDARNIGNNTTATEETSSIRILMENIATNILMSLSFAFSGCILIFEGESSFLAAIMESSDALYASAASLDMNLQLFCSYLPESTDEIILSCITHANKSNSGLYPAMLESETLGESFLTRFPSVNPLSAHAILSSGGMLLEFLEWSHQRRIQAVGKYHIPDESISLFSALCRYGELGESGMTECSSIDSDISSSKMQSRKRQKYAMSAQTLDVRLDDSLYVESLDPSNDGIIELPQASQPYQSRNFPNAQGRMKKHENRKFSVSGNVLENNWGVKTSVINDLDRNDIIDCEDFSDEVNDLDCIFLDERFPPIAETMSFFRNSESSKPAVKSSLSSSKLALGTTSHRIFPTSAEINSGTDKWTSLRDQNQNADDKICGWSTIGSNRDAVPLKHQENLKENFMQECTRNVPGLSINEKVVPVYSENLFSNAIQSSRQQRGSHSTIEFLNRVKEKSRAHQQTLPCNTCLTCPGSLRNREKSSKSQSPSIIDSYRYQGVGQMKKIVKQKWKKGVTVDLDSYNDKKMASSFINSTWTPIDKRARQNLSFARNGKEKQSKLVWRSRKSPGMGFSMRKRYRDEG